MLLKTTNPKNSVRRRFHHFLIARRKSSAKLPTAMPKHHSRRIRFWDRLRSPAYSLFRKISVLCIAAGILTGMFYVIFFSSFFTVTRVILEKNGGAVSAAELAPFLDSLKDKNLLFLNAGSLADRLEQSFQNEILFAEIHKSYPHKAVVKINEYPAVLNLKIINPGADEKSFILNQIGYAIFENNDQKDLPALVLRTNEAYKGGSIIIPEKKLAPIVEAFTKFQDFFGMKILSGEWMKTERELHLKTEKEFEVWLDLTAGIDRQLSKLKRALARLDIYNTSLRYIDLRISGGDSEKVIFKKR